MVSVYRRYLAVDPSVTERFTGLLLSPNNGTPRPLEAAKLLLALARKAARGEYTSPEGKSPYQLLGDWIDVVEKFPEDVGLDVDEMDTSNTTVATADDAGIQPEDEDTTSTKKLNIENILHKDGLAVYEDQAGRLWTGLATYWIKRGEFDRARDTFEQGIKSVLTIRDFTQIFDAYAEFGESLISAMMESLENEEDEGDAAETERELDARIAEFENLTDRRPFLVNDVLIRRNPNDVQEWEKRVALWGDDDEKVCVWRRHMSCPRLTHLPLRLLKHTRMHWKRSTHAKQPLIYIDYTSILPNSTRRAERWDRPNQIWPVHARFWKKARK
jgi:pre-mRNA-splicing factor SYF1